MPLSFITVNFGYTHIIKPILSKPDYRYDRYIYKTIADADGKFEFKNVPSGEYYLVTSIYWETHNGSYFVTQGGILVKKVKVENGKKIKLILTGRDLKISRH